MKANEGDIVKFEHSFNRYRPPIRSVGRVIKIKNFGGQGIHYNIFDGSVVYSVKECNITEIVENSNGSEKENDSGRNG